MYYCMCFCMCISSYSLYTHIYIYIHIDIHKCAALMCASDRVESGENYTVSFQMSCLFLRPRPWQFEILDNTNK